jgi:hypothetical protein
MIINVKPDKNHKPMYIVDGTRRKPSLIIKLLFYVGHIILFMLKIVIIICIIILANYILNQYGLELHFRSVLETIKNSMQ